MANSKCIWCGAKALTNPSALGLTVYECGSIPGMRMDVCRIGELEAKIKRLEGQMASAGEVIRRLRNRGCVADEPDDYRVLDD